MIFNVDRCMLSLEILFIVIITSIAVLIYTMGGFGGGSIFIAILIFSGVPPSQAAIGGLLFNIFSTGASFTRWKRHLEKKFLLLLLGSVPLAFIGGIMSLYISEHVLKIVIGLIVAGSGFFTLFFRRTLANLKVNLIHIIFIGGLVGFLAGLTGIGGGVYLAPILLLSGISNPKTTAATTTFFIFSNSLAGIFSRINKIIPAILENQIIITLIPVVVVAALIGGHIGSRKLSQENVRKIIGIILISIGLLLIFY
ncbi:MAG: sulfite exporter TauE/SafE family protein [Nitrososphaerota archaeon]